MKKEMNQVFVWLTDIEEYAKANNTTPSDVYSKMVIVAEDNGYECDKSWFDIVGSEGKALIGISMEVDDIDGFCFSAGIDQDYFRKITVEEWLSY